MPMYTDSTWYQFFLEPVSCFKYCRDIKSNTDTLNIANIYKYLTKILKHDIYIKANMFPLNFFFVNLYGLYFRGETLHTMKPSSSRIEQHSCIDPRHFFLNLPMSVPQCITAQHTQTNETHPIYHLIYNRIVYHFTLRRSFLWPY